MAAAAAAAGWGVTEWAAAVQIGETLVNTTSNTILAAVTSEIACVVEVSNFTKWRMSAPNMYMDHGLIDRPPVSIAPGTKEACSFHKEKWSLYGCGGVCAWQLDKDTGNKVEVLIAPYIPYQHMWLDNSLSVAVAPADTYKDCRETDLFSFMYDKDYKLENGSYFPCTRETYDKKFNFIKHSDAEAGILIEANFGSSFKAVATVYIYPMDAANLHKKKGSE